MKEYYGHAKGMDDIAKELVRYIEKETGEKIFTLRTMGERENEILDVLIVFENRDVLMGEVIFMIEDDHLVSVRVRGDYI